MSQKKIVLLLNFPWLFVSNKNKIIKQKSSFTAMYMFSQEHYCLIMDDHSQCLTSLITKNLLILYLNMSFHCWTTCHHFSVNLAKQTKLTEELKKWVQTLMRYKRYTRVSIGSIEPTGCDFHKNCLSCFKFTLYQS